MSNEGMHTLRVIIGVPANGICGASDEVIEQVNV